MVFEHVDPMLRVKRSRASAPHRREPPGTGDALRMKSGHESETTRAGHNVRRVASVQFSASHVDIRFEKLQIIMISNSLAVQFSTEMSNREGTTVARCTVERLMAELGLAGAIRGKSRRTTIADPAAARPADLVQRQFAPPAPNRLWVADLTYVSTWSGFAYVAFVVDAYARRILGWRVASTMATSMVLDAIEQSIWTRQQEGVLDLKDVVHHTDRGSQYRRSGSASASRKPGSNPPSVRSAARMTRAWLHSAPPVVGWVRTRFLSGLPCRTVRRGSSAIGRW